MLVCLAAGVLPVAQAQPTITLDPSKAISQYAIDQWTTEHGLPMKRISSVTQSADGYIWLGTQEGVVRFDGFTFDVFDKRREGLESKTITAVLEDSRGTLWIGTVAGLSRYSKGRFETLTIEDGLSDNYVSALLEDAHGRIWVGSYGSGISVIDGRFITGLNVEGGGAASSISALYQDVAGTIWIGTTDAGLLRYQDGALSSYSSSAGLPSNDVTRISGNDEGTLWVGTKGGLATLRNGTVRTHTTADGLPSNIVRALHEDAEGTLWIGTEGGLTRLRGDRLETYDGDDHLSSVLAIHEDREGSLWVGTQRSGLFRLQDGTFTTFTTTEGLGGNSVYSVYQDVKGSVWAGTLGGGVSRIRDGEITTLTADDGLKTNDIVSIYGSKNGTLWFGTAGLGLIRYRNGVLRQYTNDDGLPGNGIYTIFEDSRGILWLGAGRAGLVRFDGKSFVTYTTEDGLTDNSVTAVTDGSDNRLWVGTYHGGLNLIEDGVVTRTYTTENGLPNNYVSSTYLDGDGMLWIATREGGLTRLKDGELKSLTVEQGLFNDTILHILEDDNGNLWMSSNRGLFRVHKADVHAVLDGRIKSLESTAYDRSDGLKTFEFNGGSQPAGWKDQQGRLWFVSSNGVVRVDPTHLRRNEVPPQVVIEQVLVMEETVRTDTAAVLAPGENNLEIDFVGLSYRANEEVAYRYMLDGIDRDWVDAGSRRQAFYTNLPPGEYTFRVVARNADGVWSDSPATFSFYLKPFFYQTAWFYVLMGILLVLVGVAIFQIRIRQLKAGQLELEATVRDRTRDLREEKRKVEESKAVIEEQAEQLRELDRVKTRFFGNISHEFRTPLTLNIGPLENALSGVYGPVPEVLKSQLTVMLRNARRLLRLINQLLDLSKLESGGVDLHLNRLDLVRFVEGVSISFSAFTEKAGIELKFAAEAESVAASFDPEAMEKVFYNVLSNAVKFTPKGGRIEILVSPSDTQESAEVRIRDTGDGIPAAELPHIFDRFHQAEGSSSNVQQGTGIGLALVKELVELHDGSITVESEVGHGTEFTIVIPVGEDTGEPLGDPDEALGYSFDGGMAADLAVYNDDETDEVDGEHLISGDGALHEHVIGGPPESALILVTDDNPDIRTYMISCLSGMYRTISAKNGQDAFEKAKRHTPDLIISDVMMPKMTGYDLCRAVRAEDSISMTPIILVTSKAAVDDKIEGLEAGADDYLPKPFNAEELFARVRNLLILRKQQHELQDLNDTLQDKNVELEEASELKSQLLRIAAHDLKNPLNNIREFANLIREEVDADSEVGDMLSLIERSSNQMFGLISQILESEALESGQLQISKKPVDLAGVAAAVVQSNRKQAERKNQQIVFDTPRAATHVVDGSAEWLTEAMDNLVSNAIKYSPSGKKIWVTVRRSREQIEFEVRDEGPGLTENDKGLLFQKFQRLSTVPTGGETSTGLGLSIVKQIAEMHDGDVVVESERGVGTAFIIRLDPSVAAVEA
jgi:signal transduction histidine kinase/ligand-binding sensor domain-containing protein